MEEVRWFAAGKWLFSHSRTVPESGDRQPQSERMEPGAQLSTWRVDSAITPELKKLLASLSSSELSSHQMAIQSHPGVQNFPASLISSKLCSHQMAIQRHPGVCIFQLTSNHFGIFGPTGYVRSGPGVFPRQAHVPFSASLFFRLWCVFTLFLSYEGEAVDAVTPAGLPQGPFPFEEDKLIHATTRTASSGPWRWIPPGVAVACKVSALFPELLLFEGPPCGHMAAMRVPSCSTMRTSSSFFVHYGKVDD